MVNQEYIVKAEEKLTFAEYLANPQFSDNSYNTGAMKHAIEAGKLAVRALLSDRYSDSPRAVQLALLKFEEPEPQKFASNFIKSWQAMGDEGSPGKPTVWGVINDVKTFIRWLKEYNKSC